MKKIILAICICILPFFLASCSVKSDDFRVIGLESFDIGNISNPSLKLEVENLSGKKLQAKDGHLILKRISGQQIAEVMLEETVTVPKRSRGYVDVPLKLRINDPLFMLGSALGRKFLSSDLTLTGTVVVKAGGMRKKIEVEEMPLSRFLSIFGVEEGDIKNFRI